MIVLKNNQPLKLLIIIGISLTTTLILIVGTIMIHTQGFAPFTATVHAATSISASCATTKGKQQILCEHQDPVAQGCVIDAETLDLQTVFQDKQQTKPLGEVELRYSPVCKAYWVRTTAFITTKGIFKTVHAMILFHNQQKEDIVGTPIYSGARFAYVVWTDMTTAPMIQHVGSGSFDIIGQPRPLTVSLKA